MMRRLLPLLFVVVYSTAYSQGPKGKLYMITGTGGVVPPVLSFVEYPGGTYTVVDTIQLSDFLVANDKLVAATLGDIVFYDTSGYQITHTIHNVSARHLASSNNQLAAVSIANPYFRIYDLSTGSLLFGIDTTELADIPNDVQLSGDKAYVLLGDSLMIIDLLQQKVDTILYTPHPFAFAGYNFHMIEADNDLYITVEYITGALRTSLIRMNKITLAFDTVYHLEGYGGFNRPILAGDRIYMYAFDSYYDITHDQLHLSPNLWYPHVIDYDDQSEALFLYNYTVNGVNYSLNGILSDTIVAGQNVLKAMFVPENEDTCTMQDIPLNIGWNMISSFIAPDQSDILGIIDNIDSDVLIIKNGSGAVTIPSLGINTIGNWNFTEGYKIKSLSNTALTIGCQLVDATTPVLLSAGWSIIAYLRTSPMDITTALNSITGNLLIVKDAYGNSYIPHLSINTIGNMQPGHGYQVKMSVNGMLIYPGN